MYISNVDGLWVKTVHLMLKDEKIETIDLDHNCLCLTADLKVIYVHDLMKIVGNSVSNVQIAFISSDLRRSSLFGITCFGSIRYLTLACKHL